MPHAISLHIGLNSVDAAAYNGWAGELLACENDATSMEAIASRLGYKTQTLLTRLATSKAVIEAIQTVARELKGGDIFVLTYSGHGGQVPDRNGDEIDGQDETWVLYDRQLVDDELHELYTEFASGVRIFVLSDSCHSGSVTRGLYNALSQVEEDQGVRRKGSRLPKALPRDVAIKLYERDRKLYDGIQDRTKRSAGKSPASTVLLISGCQDNQLSSDGDVNGLFTEKLLRVWNDGQYALDYRSFQRAIKRTMPPSQQPNYFVVGTPNKTYEKQKPFEV